MTACIGTPVSWLRLEQLVVGDLDASRAKSLREHLDECAACARSLESIEGDHRVLQPLNLAPSDPVVSFDRFKARFTRWALAGAVGLAAAAALLFVVLRSTGDDTVSLPSNRVAIKGGGELVLTVVRQRGDVQTRDPSTFLASDRFKVVVTCAEPTPIKLDVVVWQAGDAFRPLGPARQVRCGNNITVQGAFAIDGAQPATVCVSPRDGSDSSNLAAIGDSACMTLDPEP